MPVYVYECEACGTFEVVQAISEDPRNACPTCGAPVQRVIVPGGSFRFKGGAPTPRFHP